MSLLFSTSNALYADVILPLNLPQTLTYGVPVELADGLQPGMRVEVQLGANKQYAGIVAALHHDAPEHFEVKPIRAVLDEVPVVTEKQLQLWQWISWYYMASPGEVMQAALPAHLKLMGETRIQWAPHPATEAFLFSAQAQAAVMLLKERKTITISDLRALVGKMHLIPVLHELLHAQSILINDALEPAFKPKTEKIVILHPRYEQKEQLADLFAQLSRAPKQIALLQTYLQLSVKGEAVPYKELLERAGANGATLRQLADKEIFFIEEQEVDRISRKNAADAGEIVFTPHQENIFKELNAGLQEKDVALLQGVTGSGKTLLYIQKIKDCMAAGRQALLLLPEIGLTTQLVSRLFRYFGDELGVYHSRFSNNERVEIWEKVRNGTYKVVAGPRSALWLPYQDLGLIIVDEEHDPSFKQRDPAPRFHARDAAVYYAGLHGAKTILGSATPSVETLYNVATGKYAFAHLKERYQGVNMPQIELVNAASLEQVRKQGFQILTPELQEAMQEALSNHRQIILFQNRRGYAPFQICTMCGWVPQCPNCAVSLTYHKSSDKMHCHYCGTVKQPSTTCLQCGSNKIISRSFGTEKIEEEVKAAFPNARVARMDIDSMRGKHALSRLLEDLDNRQIDILVGTQMVVKGLDFAPVSLVGVLSADALLNYPDFRVNERAFQLMEQVSGRAGRADGAGKVLIQAYNLQHPVLNWVQSHDVSAFYRHEIGYREFFHYPPFVRIIKVICRHKEEQKAIAAGAEIAQAILTKTAENNSIIAGAEVQGPVPAVVARVRNQYVQEVWIKIPRDIRKLEAVKSFLWKERQRVGGIKLLKEVNMIFDVDPG